MKVYDLIILGAGPAGITAAVYAARKKIDFLVVTLDIGGQAAISGDIENYTGYQFITGPELALKFEEHMRAFDIAINMPEAAKNITKVGHNIKVTTNKNEYLSKATIIATGKRPRLLNVEGEKEFKNKGVTYCAVCDGPLFRDRRVAIIGGGNSGLDAALQMLKISPKVYIIDSAPQLRGDPIMAEKAKGAPNAELWNSTKVKRIFGDSFVKGIEVEKDGKGYNLAVEGVFVEIGLIPNSECASIVERNALGEIIVDSFNHTNIEGIFSAGDVTNAPEKQIIIACGEGSKACLSAVRYLETQI